MRSYSFHIRCEKNTLAYHLQTVVQRVNFSHKNYCAAIALKFLKNLESLHVSDFQGISFLSTADIFFPLFLLTL
ncbi:MAG: hypothetical protein ACI9S8_002397 [Chlamydiales bacterium]|jgi:hypothetical protein